MILPHHSHPACRYIERNVPVGISRAPMSIVTRPGRVACLYWTWSPGPFLAIIQPSCLSLVVTSRVLFECSALPMTSPSLLMCIEYTQPGRTQWLECVLVCICFQAAGGGYLSDAGWD